jgi:agmatine/peptidylarginine deiminase
MATDNECSTITPVSSGFFMTVEWEPHESTWQQWPNNRVEPGYEMKQERTWLEMVTAIVMEISDDWEIGRTYLRLDEDNC